MIAGVDVGSSTITVSLREPSGAPLASCKRATPVRCVGPGEAEHDPDELWRAMLETITAAARDAGGAISAIAFASVGEAGVFVGEDGEELGPVLAWWDLRPRAACDAIVERIGAQRIAAITGLCADPTFSLPKIAWTLPRLERRPARFLNIANWAAWRLCGEAASDPSLASRTMAFDLASEAWSSELLAIAGADRALMAPILEAGAPLGAARGGLEPFAPGCVVANGCHDHVSAAIATGCRRPCELLDDLGTAEALHRPLASPLAPAFTDGAVQRAGLQISAGARGARYLFGGLPTAAACLAWFERALAADRDPSALREAAARAAPGPLFLPHLRLGSPPFPDAPARGAFLGLSDQVDRAQLYRAALEGIALDAASIERTMTRASGLAPPERTIAIGAALDGALAEIKAAAFARPLLRIAERDGGSFEAAASGAAMLASLAAGHASDLDEARAAHGLREWTIEPCPAETRRLEERAALHEEARDALRGVHARLAQLEAG